MGRAISALTYMTLAALIGGRFGAIDVPCPLCGPDRRSPANRRRRVLRLWRDDPAFIRYSCARCRTSGFARNDSAATKVERTQRATPVEEQRDDGPERSRHALAIWREALPIAGTVAEHYLAARGIDVAVLPSAIGETLRWHPRCVWGQGRHACMVALWTDAVTGEPRSIHRTAITTSAEKIGRKSLGPTANSVIRLWPDDEIERGLVIGEGVETVLAAATRIEHRGTFIRPAWAAGDAGHVAAFPVLHGVECLTLLVDHDETGMKAAAECSARWRQAGKEVIRLVPRALADFNDIIRGDAP